MPEFEGVPQLDVGLLAGFGFACRPGCGLCCYAEPRVLPFERAQLLKIAPEAEFVDRGPDRFLGARPEGGACQMLQANACTVHSARPHPCREFPLTAHVGVRLQATVVLSCPGVELGVLQGYPAGDRPDAPLGFPTELLALRERVDRSSVRRLEASRRRRRKIARQLESEGRWVEEDEVRHLLRRKTPLPTDEDFPASDPPPAEDGVDLLPLFFDGRPAPVALSEGLGGWEVHELAPEGGLARPLGVFPPPDRMPRLGDEAVAVLRGYLRYWLERDALFGAVHLRMMDARDGEVTDHVEEELRSIGALVVARAVVRAKLRRGESDHVSAVDLEEGVRATDQDLLDRGSWGDRF